MARNSGLSGREADARRQVEAGGIAAAFDANIRPTRRARKRRTAVAEIVLPGGTRIRIVSPPAAHDRFPVNACAADMTDTHRPGSDTTSPVTEILHQARAGDREAMDRLVSLVYDELHALAHRKLAFEQAGHTLQTTALVHEAYLRLVDQTRVDWQNRTHFFAVAALAMRRILVNHAEGRRAAKRGGAVVPLELEEAHAAAGTVPDDRILALDEALTRLSRFNERGARVVEYRFFGGLDYDEIAAIMGLSAITVRRAWETARAWLKRELESDFISSN
jgi:RNA polymerase sigma factor (TIGR02999 family)